MAEGERLLKTIEAVHAAGLGAQPWQDALATMAGLFGSEAVTLERFDVTSGRLREYHAFGVPPAHELEYLADYAAANPRAAHGMRHPKIPLQWDYQFTDEAGMGRDPYYADFLQRVGLRYYISAQLQRTSDEMAVVAVQRTPAQGHVGTLHIDLMELLLPHLRQAFDTAMRLRAASGTSSALKDTLDWLADGVALVTSDGSVVYANDALQTIARRRDGLRVAKRGFEFSAPETRARFAMALAAVAGPPTRHLTGAGANDLAVRRGSGLPPYLISVRPLRRTKNNEAFDVRAVAIVFVRDPLSRNPAASQVLRDVFGFTEAEANLAQALQAGMSVPEYARENALSINTIYTHLRRVREKTGCHRLPELIRMLNELRLPLRSA